jgi:citrate synthase
LINMLDREPLYLTAPEAAAALGVSVTTIYAYVSRGLIRSEAGSDGRAKRYRGEDVRNLANRRAPATLEIEEAQPFALDSGICLMTPEGPFYRGVPAVTLAASSSFESVATLLWSAGTDDPFAEARGSPVLWAALDPMIAAMKGRPFIDQAAAIMALAADLDPGAYNGTQAGAAAIGARCIRLLTALATGEPPARTPIHKALAAAWAPDRPEAAEMIRRNLVLIADHELNASAFAARVAASTGASLYDAAAAALSTLKGPRHGGASVSARRFLETLAGRDPVAVIKELRAGGERLPGFGHAIYRAADPRAVALLSALEGAGAPHSLTRAPVEAAREVAGVDPNVDYAHAALAIHFGFPPGSEMTVFAIGRMAGWIAHAMEQRMSGRIIRPRARYVGVAPRAS